MAQDQPASAAQLAFALLDLARRARLATTAAELRFLLVNDSRGLAPYRQAAFWTRDGGVQALSGLLQVETNAPYVQWLEKVADHCATQYHQPTPINASDLGAELAEEWGQWLPSDALWLPLHQPADAAAQPPRAAVGGVLLARDLPWTPAESALLTEWLETWWHALRLATQDPGWSVGSWRRRLHRTWQRQRGLPWWRQLRWRVALAVLVLFCIPVRLSVLASAELVPANPVVVRSPLEGVIGTFHVQPNQLVKKDQPLFGFDEALIQSRLDVATQALSTAETEYRQAMQQALTEAKFKPQLAALTGKIEERRAEVDYLREQLARSRVLAPQEGVVLFDDPTEWIGKPVGVGERILRLARTDDVEVEAWLPIADAIVLPPQAPVQLYLNASPLDAVAAQVRYVAFEAVQRPDTSFAYRVRATLAAPTEHRVGLKGTAKLQGEWVPLVYWVFRRPLAALRTTLGV